MVHWFLACMMASWAAVSVKLLLQWAICACRLFGDRSLASPTRKTGPLLDVVLPLLLIQRGSRRLLTSNTPRDPLCLTHQGDCSRDTTRRHLALTRSRHSSTNLTTRTAAQTLSTRSETHDAAPCTQSLQQHAVAARRHRRKRTGRFLHGKVHIKRQQRRASHNTR